MNRQTFIDSFGHIADAPGGIDKIRALVLDLAVRGRLVEQDEKEKSAAIAIASAADNRSAWVEPTAPAKYSRKDSGYPLGSGTLPTNWVHCRLGEILQLVNGRAYKKAEWKTHGTPVIRIQNLSGGDEYYFSDLSLKPHNYCDTGDLLFAWSASFGPYIWTGGRAIFHYHIWKVRTSPALDRQFAFRLLAALTSSVRAASHGLAMLHMTKEAMEGLVCPIPPIAEQRRIVDCVDDLMLLCDELAAQQEARTAARTALTAATLHRTSRAESAPELGEAVAALSENIAIHLAPGDGDFAALKLLRQTLLDLAVRGQLTHHDSSDEPAAELIRRIICERDRMVAAKVIRKPRAQAPTLIGDREYRLPVGWEWAALGQLVLASDSGWSPACLPSRRDDDSQWGVLKVSAVSWGDFRPAEHKQLTPGLVPRPQIEVKDGDFIMSRANTAQLVGRSVVASDPPPRLMLSDKHIRLRFLDRASAEYVNLVNGSSSARKYYAAVATGTSDSMRNITREQILSLPIPVPPLMEQERIVDVVRTLHAHCDDLERQFLEAQCRRQELSASVAARVVGGGSSVPAVESTVGDGR